MNCPNCNKAHAYSVAECLARSKGTVAQGSERRPYKPEDAGSNPARPTEAKPKTKMGQKRGRPLSRKPSQSTVRKRQQHAQKASRIPRASRDAVSKRSGMRCEIRGPNCIGKATELDHIVSRGMGGRKGQAKALNNDPSNLQAVCWPCHLERHGNVVAIQRDYRDM